MCAAVIALALALLPPSPRYAAKVDFIGGALITVSIAALTLGVARIGDPDALMALWCALAAVCFALFVWRQLSATEPLLPRAMFRA